MIFDLHPIWGLLPLLLYIVLSFKKGTHPVANVGICTILGAILVKQPLGKLGAVVHGSMSSFLVLVGLIIMLGGGLGSVLRKTGVAANIVSVLTKRIGIKNQNRAIIATMICSIVLIALLGTPAGANAVIAPIIIPLVSSVGLTPSSLATIFLGAGSTGMFLGPLSPIMVTLMGLTGLTYPQLLFSAGLPLSVVMWVSTFLIVKKIQKDTEGTETFGIDLVSGPREDSATPESKRATTVFVISMLCLVGYGIFSSGGASYVIVVMVTTSLLTGISGGMSAGEVLNSMMEGAGKLIWLFFMFILFDPFLKFVEQTGAFSALVNLTEPYIASTGKLGFALLTTLIGIFGINGAAVAQAIMMDKLFNPFLNTLGVSPNLWALILMIGMSITSFAYPGVDMLGQMGLAHAKNIKPMMKLSYLAITPASVLLVAVASIFI
jgi:H+/gluconate symporter-like permease